MKPYLPLDIQHDYKNDIVVNRKWIHRVNGTLVVEKSIDCTNECTIISDLHKCFYLTGHYFGIDDLSTYIEIFNTQINLPLYNLKKKKIYYVTTYYEVFSKFGYYDNVDISVGEKKIKLYKYPRNLSLSFNKKKKIIEFKKHNC